MCNRLPLSARHQWLCKDRQWQKKKIQSVNKKKKEKKEENIAKNEPKSNKTIHNVHFDFATNEKKNIFFPNIHFTHFSHTEIYHKNIYTHNFTNFPSPNLSCWPEKKIHILFPFISKTSLYFVCATTPPIQYGSSTAELSGGVKSFLDFIQLSLLYKPHSILRTRARCNQLVRKQGEPIRDDVRLGPSLFPETTNCTSVLVFSYSLLIYYSNC